jgi:hypothetical protein
MMSCSHHPPCEGQPPTASVVLVHAAQEVAWNSTTDVEGIVPHRRPCPHCCLQCMWRTLAFPAHISPVLCGTLLSCLSQPPDLPAIHRPITQSQAGGTLSTTSCTRSAPSGAIASR